MIFETVSASPQTPPAASATPLAGSFRLTLEQAPCAGQSFSVVFQVCENPCCPCQALALECAPTADPKTPLCFDVDPFARKLKPNWRTRTNANDLALGQAFVAEATSEHWAWLVRYFRSVKRHQMDSMDLDQLDVQWPPEVAAGTATMVGYVEIFPWTDAILFDHDGAQWAVDDQYCVQPDCDCVEAGLAFFQLPGTVSRSTRRRRALLFLYYNYRTATLRAIEKNSRCPDPEHLLQALRSAKPDLDRTFDQRHRQLKQLSRRLLHPSAQRRRPSLSNNLDEVQPIRLIPPISPPVIRPPKIGRNDPCPCGSGMKYKKCCGAN